MPKIAAPTVAEHHAQRRSALLAAATTLLAEGGIDAVTPGAVGAAAGLARSSVYQYFDSTPALLAAVVEYVMPQELERMRASLGEVADPRERLETYVRYLLSAATDPTHRSMAALRGGQLPPECQSRIRELHHEMYAPLRQSLLDLGVDDVALTSSFIVGLVDASTRAVLRGSSESTVADTTLAFIWRGLGTNA